MNSKNALFLSASLTAFVLAILFGVVTKITSINSAQAAAPAADSALVEQAAVDPTAVLDVPAPTDIPATATLAPAAVVPPTPEEAAGLAATALNRQDVYSVETFSFNGLDTYKVVFVTGDSVIIGMDRKVLSIAPPEVVAVDAPTPTISPAIVYYAPEPVVPVKKSHKSGGGGGGGGGGGEHEGGDD